jgi:AraC-like DNA-binding protein
MAILNNEEREFLNILRERNAYRDRLVDMTTILEVARVGLAMCFDEIAQELDLSDEELKRIQKQIYVSLGEKS